MVVVDSSSFFSPPVSFEGLLLSRLTSVFSSQVLRPWNINSKLVTTEVFSLLLELLVSFAAFSVSAVGFFFFFFELLWLLLFSKISIRSVKFACIRWWVAYDSSSENLVDISNVTMSGASSEDSSCSSWSPRLSVSPVPLLLPLPPPTTPVTVYFSHDVVWPSESRYNQTYSSPSWNRWRSILSYTLL